MRPVNFCRAGVCACLLALLVNAAYCDLVYLGSIPLIGFFLANFVPNAVIVGLLDDARV